MPADPFLPSSTILRREKRQPSILEPGWRRMPEANPKVPCASTLTQVRHRFPSRTSLLVENHRRSYGSNAESHRGSGRIREELGRRCCRCRQTGCEDGEEHSVDLHREFRSQGGRRPRGSLSSQRQDFVCARVSKAPLRARAERRALPFSLPCRSALHESEKLGIDHVGVCRTHAVREPLVDLESALL
jgi:hypothetical protein